MKPPALLKGLKKTHDAYDRARSRAIALSNVALHASKRAIFAMQRDDLSGCKALLAEAEGKLAEVRRAADVDIRLMYEGAVRAAQEEYAEAVFYRQLAENGDVEAIPGLDEETQIAGLCDAAGELVRRMIAAATEGRAKDVAGIKATIEAIVAGLTEMDFGGYLRTKYDQARAHLRKAEDIAYDVSLRAK